MPKLFLKTSVWLFILLPTCVIAATGEYTSHLINQTNQNNGNGYRLVKTKMWPNTRCLLDTGKQIVNPGETTILKIKKDKKCNESGVGYSIYRLEDKADKDLLGYLSHRFADGKFSIQISRFCEGDKCVFTDLNPAQNRSNMD